MLENDTETNHDVSGYLVLKDAGKWRIAAHAWDHEETTLGMQILVFGNVARDLQLRYTI